MEKYMVKVLNEGKVDYLPIRGINEKSALRKAINMYQGVVVEKIIPKYDWIIKMYGASKSPTLIMTVLSDEELQQEELVQGLL